MRWKCCWKQPETSRSVKHIRMYWLGKRERKIQENTSKICVRFTSTRRWNVSTSSKRFSFKKKANSCQFIKRLSTQAQKVWEIKCCNLFWYSKQNIERFSFNWIHWIRIRKWWYSTKDTVTSWKRSSWICRLWSSAFGSELNFHDDTLAAANESQNISETSNSDQNLSSASTKKTKLRKKMKGFLKNRPNKIFKGSYEKNKKLEHQRSKSFRKN